LVRKYHPDTNLEDPRAEERFKEVQQAYEILSNHEKRHEYGKRPRTSPRGNSGGPRAGAGRRTGGGTAHTVDLSEVLGKLGNLSRDGDGERKDGGFQLRDEEVAHLGKLLGEKITRVSALLGADPARLSKLLDKNIKMNVKANLEMPSMAGSRLRTKICRAGNRLGWTTS
jgi:curved DNA-binding protein CbpA